MALIKYNPTHGKGRQTNVKQKPFDFCTNIKSIVRKIVVDETKNSHVLPQNSTIRLHSPRLQQNNARQTLINHVQDVTKID